MLIYRKRVIPDNMEKIIVGDVHGEHDKLEGLLNKYNIDKKNTFIISVGDIIDRGPKIAECCEDFLTKENYDMCIGNHEDFMLARNNRSVFPNWLANGGQQTINQLGFDTVDLVSQEILDRIPVILEIEHRGKTFGIVHAEISNRYQTIDWQEIIKRAHTDEDYLSDLIWSRYTINQVIQAQTFGGVADIPPVSGIDFVIHGHTGVRKPIINGNRIWIDTLYQSGNITFARYNDQNNQWEFCS